jgi:hypothetical protein
MVVTDKVALPEELADVTERVNIANARAHSRSSIGRTRTMVWVFGQIVGVSMGRIVD